MSEVLRRHYERVSLRMRKRERERVRAFVHDAIPGSESILCCSLRAGIDRSGGGSGGVGGEGRRRRWRCFVVIARMVQRNIRIKR